MRLSSFICVLIVTFSLLLRLESEVSFLRSKLFNVCAYYAVAVGFLKQELCSCKSFSS